MRGRGQCAAVDGVGFRELLLLIQHDAQHSLRRDVIWLPLQLCAQSLFGGREIAAFERRHRIGDPVIVRGTRD